MNSAGISGSPPDENEPPNGSNLARRIAALESRFDIVLPTLATKTDLAELRTQLAELRTEMLVKFEALRADLIKWMAATLITILLSFAGLFAVLTGTLAVTAAAPRAAAAPVIEAVPSAVLISTQPNIPAK